MSTFLKSAEVLVIVLILWVFIFWYFVIPLSPWQDNHNSESSLDPILTHQSNAINLKWSVLNGLTDSRKMLAARTGRPPQKDRPRFRPSSKQTTEDIGAGNISEDALRASDGLPLQLWSADFHISPIQDIKGILHESTTAVEVLDNSLSNHCYLTHTCTNHSALRHLNAGNGMTLGACPSMLRNSFYEHYSGKDSQGALRRTDAFLCLHAASMCELYMPFNRTMIIIASTRYEIGRGEETSMYDGISSDLDSLPDELIAHYRGTGFERDKKMKYALTRYSDRWHLWNANLRRLSGVGRHHIIAANNVYDKHYIEYFTGLRNVLLLPSTARHVAAIRWEYPSIHYEGRESESETGGPQGLRREVLVGPAHDVHSTVLRAIYQALEDVRYNSSKSGSGSDAEKLPEIDRISSVYPGKFEYTDLAKHPAIIILPYQVSIMSFFEYYRMGIPMFVPTARLLTQWHMEHRLLSQRSWPMTHHRPQGRSIISKHASPEDHLCGDNSFAYCNAEKKKQSDLFKFDPNNEFDADAVRAWVELGDFYTWPHIIQFDTPLELIRMLSARDTLVPALQLTSDSMRAFMSEIDEGVGRSWDSILAGIKQDSAFRQYTDVGDYPGTLNEALQEQYGYQLDPEDCYREVNE